MKYVLPLFLLLTLLGAGCETKYTAVPSPKYSFKDLVIVGQDTRRKEAMVDIGQGNTLAPDEPKPIMVTVKLKTPIKQMKVAGANEWCTKPILDGSDWYYSKECGEETVTTTQIPLQEFVDLLDYKYVPATSTTKEMPAMLVK